MFSDNKKRQSKPNLNDSYSVSSVQLNRAVNLSNFDEEFEINDCLKFNEYITKTLYLFQIEVMLITKLFDSEKLMASRILERIFDPVLKFLFAETEVN